MTRSLMLRASAVAMMGLASLGRPRDVEAFDVCDDWMCAGGGYTCTSQHIEALCAWHAQQHGCTSTGGACGSHPNCDPDVWFYCTDIERVPHGGALKHGRTFPSL
jgi:hypothetical protein